MAVFKYAKQKVQSAAAMKAVLSYALRKDKVTFEGQRIVSGKDCSPNIAYTEFMNSKKMYGKDNGCFFYHYLQSFSKDDHLTPRQANTIGLDFAQRQFPEFEVVVATHVDAKHLHNHLIVNSVSFENGKKLRQNPNSIFEHRKVSDEICRQHGLTILDPYTERKNAKYISAGEYKAALKGGSWKFTLIRAIDDALLRSRNRDEFIQNMNYEGIEVKWTDTRKKITYTMTDGKKCCDDKLHDEQYLKENLEALFAQRIRNGFVPFTPEPDGGWITPTESDDNDSAIPNGDIVHDALRLGKEIEDVSQQRHNASSAIGHEDSRVRQREKIRRLAAGHALRDELEEDLTYHH